MYSEISTVARGNWDYIWKISSEIEHWGVRFPHYRKVTLLHRSPDGLEKRAYMSAWRDVVPVSWRTIQRLQPSSNPAEARIFFQHIGGVTKGMEVEWIFEPLGDNAYRITIAHDWLPPWPLIKKKAASLINKFVIENVAGKTLARVSRMAAHEAANRQPHGATR